MSSKVKILLVNPWVTDFSLYDFWIKPLGLLIIGSILKKEGFDVSLVDFLDRHNPYFREKLSEKELKEIRDRNFSTGKFPSREIPKPRVYENIKRKYKIYGWSEEVIKEYLKKQRGFDFIFITSGMTYWYPGIRKTVDFLKSIYPDAVFVLGGRYVFFCKEHAEKNFSDLFLISDVKIKDILEKIERLTCKKIDIERFSEYKSISFEFYLEYPILKHFAIIRSLGCPFRCIYCASSILYPEFTMFDDNNIIKEIEKIHLLKNARDFAFYDDALLYPKEKFKEFLKKFIEKSLDIRVHTPNAIHARYIDQEMAELLKKANFKTIRIGFETINEEKLKKIWSGKLMLRDFENAIFNLKKAGFEEEIGAYVLIGTLNDDLDEIMKTYEYLFKNKVKIYPAQFSPLPFNSFFNKEEPLLSNKSIYPCGNPNIGFSLYEKIKDFAKVLNRNLFTNSSFTELYKKFFDKESL
ncbi:MAG: B12-binding domain-containing radical SAM protein [Candidatus Hydrothermales bacterium]